jgi:phospholipid/cholesterol/gamma-HCH transport system permease protein
MSAVSARPERLVTTTPSVARQDSQDGVVLSLAGEWIVGAGPQLEAAGASLLSLAKDAKRVILDLAGLQRMDTAGAWFIDRAQDELAGAGATVSYRGEQPKHDLLLKEAGYHPPEKSTLVHPAHTVALLSAIGETIYDSGVDFLTLSTIPAKSS